jgi:methyltransferase (TIGR00027 family)
MLGLPDTISLARLQEAVAEHPHFGSVILRSRYAADLCASREWTRLLSVGSGLDTLAHRVAIPEVVEIDREESAAAKEELLRKMKLERSGSHHIVGADLGSPALLSRLRGVWKTPAPTVVLMLGVAAYLPAEVLTSVLTRLADIVGPGSELVVSYRAETSGGPCDGVAPALAAAGEPWRAPRTERFMVDLLDTAGWRAVTTLPVSDLAARYQRPELARSAPAFVRLIHAERPAPPARRSGE